MTTPTTSTAHSDRTPRAAHTFTQRFSSTPRGARLARRLTVLQLDRWGVPLGGELSDAAALVVAELAANAVTHGRVAGRDFELRLTRAPGAVLRIEVSDAHGERKPPAPGALCSPGAGEGGGWGLLLVEALADRWSVHDRVPVGKTVRAEFELSCRP
ncbi:ATP-binding protein [Streptomyces griseus]|uniref:ATP-binding protein n=1 Tax=Streptomyces griseus TaxID=1911 RepID=UPI0008402241|nr:ATP-binding protein [Streptomyces griseus]